MTTGSDGLSRGPEEPEALSARRTAYPPTQHSPSFLKSSPIAGIQLSFCSALLSSFCYSVPRISHFLASGQSDGRFQPAGLSFIPPETPSRNFGTLQALYDDHLSGRPEPGSGFRSPAASHCRPAARSSRENKRDHLRVPPGSSGPRWFSVLFLRSRPKPRSGGIRASVPHALRRACSACCFRRSSHGASLYLLSESTGTNVRNEASKRISTGASGSSSPLRLPDLPGFAIRAMDPFQRSASLPRSQSWGEKRGCLADGIFF